MLQSIKSPSVFGPIKRSLLLAVCCTALIGGQASAAVILNTTPVDFSGGFVSIGFNSTNITFSDNRVDFFNPVSVSTVAGAAVTALGAPFYSQPMPSTYFDPVRGSGVLLFDSTVNYDSFATPTAIPFSIAPFFIGLKDVAADGTTHFGYGEFSGTTLVSYAFQTIAGAGIVTPVPLPSSAPLFGAALIALGGIGYSLKRTKAATAA